MISKQITNFFCQKMETSPAIITELLFFSTLWCWGLFCVVYAPADTSQSSEQSAAKAKTLWCWGRDNARQGWCICPILHEELNFGTPESSKITRSFYVFFAFLVWPFFLFQLRSPWVGPSTTTPPQAPGRRVAWLVVFRRLALRRLPLGWFQCLWMAPVPRSMEGAGGVGWQGSWRWGWGWMMVGMGGF